MIPKEHEKTEGVKQILLIMPVNIWESMNKKIKGMDYITYHISGDPLRIFTKVLPYYPVGKNKMITGYESAFSGNPFMSADINSLADIRDDKESITRTTISDFWVAIRTPLASQHFITGYKNLLAQDKHIFKFRKKADSNYNIPFNYAVGAALLYQGWKKYKLLTHGFSWLMVPYSFGHSDMKKFHYLWKSVEDY